jgi:hypothetical protein
LHDKNMSLLLWTLCGPSYLHANGGGVPPRRMYTYSAANSFSSGFAYDRCRSGIGWNNDISDRNLSANVSAAAAGDAPSSSPGNVSCTPNVTWAADTPASFLGATRNPRRTHGKCSSQWLPACHVRKASFNCRCSRSTRPFACG